MFDVTVIVVNEFGESERLDQPIVQTLMTDEQYKFMRMLCANIVVVQDSDGSFDVTASETMSDGDFGCDPIMHTDSFSNGHAMNVGVERVVGVFKERMESILGCI